MHVDIAECGKYNPLIVIVSIATESVLEFLDRLSYFSTSGMVNHLQMDAVRFVMSFFSVIFSWRIRRGLLFCLQRYALPAKGFTIPKH